MSFQRGIWKWTWLAFAEVLLVFTVLAWAQPPATPEPPLTNEDVVKLCKLDLGDEVVIAKINQAREVKFQLDPDSLVKLKQQGVSKAVIEAMLKRASAPREQPAATPSAAGGTRDVARAAGQGEDQFVVLRTRDRDIRLQSVLGSVSTTWAYVTVLTFLDFPGLKAEVRISDRRPSLLVRSSKNPRGRVFLVRCESDEDDNVRSVKLGKAGPFSQKSWSSPDNDWTVAYEYKELGNNEWEITPKEDLKPGEYGLLFRGGLAGVLGPTEGELFDFGVD